MINLLKTINERYFVDFEGEDEPIVMGEVVESLEKDRLPHLESRMFTMEKKMEEVVAKLSHIMELLKERL